MGKSSRRPPLPRVFIQRMDALLGAEASDFFDALESEPQVAVRLHPEKWARTGLSPQEHFPIAEDVPWCANAYLLEERVAFWQDPLLFGGAYYVSEPSGLIVTEIFRRYGHPQALVADTCAAPGGKTLQIASLLDGGLIAAAEAAPSRYSALVENVERWGYCHQVLLRADSRAFLSLPNTFDFVIVDAPCSGEGMFRKDPHARRHWRPQLCHQLPRVQRTILAHALYTLRPGGYLLYSTCTFAPEENELNIQWLVDAFPGAVESVAIDFPTEWGIVEGLKHYKDTRMRVQTYRMYPHRVRGEGFFFALMRKTASIALPSPAHKQGKTTWSVASCKAPYSLPNRPLVALGDRWFVADDTLIEHMPTLSQAPIRQVGQQLGICAQQKPPHALALLSPPIDAPHIALTYDEALRFLRGETPHSIDGDYVLAQYRNIALGWLYRSGSPPKTKNALPRPYRLRKVPVLR